MGNDVAAAIRIASGVEDLSYDDTTGDEGAAYRYWVRAVSSSGFVGDWSEATSGYRAFSPPQNTHLRALSESATMRL